MNCSERPSRLKGIETFTQQIHFQIIGESSERPSRLKGIETSDFLLVPSGSTV